VQPPEFHEKRWTLHEIPDDDIEDSS
jgi:hypothetical protein